MEDSRKKQPRLESHNHLRFYSRATQAVDTISWTYSECFLPSTSCYRKSLKLSFFASWNWNKLGVGEEGRKGCDGLQFSLKLDDLDENRNYSGLWCLKKDCQMLVDIGFARYVFYFYFISMVWHRCPVWCFLSTAKKKINSLSYFILF